MQIIALANLRTKATHSAQTALSHFRRDGDSQTWLPKAAAVQTKVRTNFQTLKWWHHSSSSSSNSLLPVFHTRACCASC
jgi:hypothetical protein